MPHPFRTRLASQHGLSLVEATIILMTIATLSAILAPVVNGYVDQARLARARNDEQVIANAIQAFMTDNGEAQFLNTASGGVTTPPTRPDGNRIDMLVGDGDIPTQSVAGESLWTTALNGTTVDTLANHLIQNSPNELAGTATRYRNPTDITLATAGGNNIDFARTASSGFNAPYAWRGPYLKGPVDPDPWGNRYAVNVLFLDPNPTALVASLPVAFVVADYQRLDVFVLSAGPDAEIDTSVAQDGAVPGDDDIIFIVSSNAR